MPPKRLGINLVVGLIWIITGYGAASGLFGWGTRLTLIVTVIYCLLGLVMLVVINLDPRLRDQFYEGNVPQEENAGVNWMWLLFLTVPPVCFIAAVAWWILRLFGFFK
jgi:hypothetical protein